MIEFMVFDQRKFKKKDQGLLGSLKVLVGSLVDLDVGGDGKLCLEKCLMRVLTIAELCTRVLTREKANTGKFIFNVSTNLGRPPIR